MAPQTKSRGGFASRILPGLIAFLFTSAVYLYTFPQPSVYYAAIVLLHTVAGIVVAVPLAVFLLRLLRDGSVVSRVGWVLLASGAVVGLFLIKTGTPPAVVAKLNAAINKAIKSDKVRDAFTKLGFDTGGGSPEEFGTMMRAEMVRWGAIVKEANIKIQ